jgi:two-component system chemotaxis sensor kinase CheA
MRMSLGAKLVQAMVRKLIVLSVATLLVVAGLNWMTSSKALKIIEGHLRVSIERKGAVLVANQALALHDLVMENAFVDVARIIARTLEQDEQLVYGLFLDEEQKAWGFSTRQGSSKDLSAWKNLALAGDAVAKTTHGAVETGHRNVLGQDVFEFSMSVVDDEGIPLGKLFYGLSDAPLRQAVAEARANSRRALLTTVSLLLLLGTVAVVVGIVRSRQSAARITQPLTDLTSAVNHLASGDRDVRVQIASGDEIEVLGVAFNNMAGELKDSYERLEHMNRTLEIRVQERTRELEERNRDMRLVMDTVNQGLLTISLDGRLAHERSAIVDQWFGAYEPGAVFAEYIAKSDPFYAISFKLGYEALIEDILPRELCIEQMPARLRRGQREYRCSYFAILKDEKMDGLLIVINDVTSELLHARLEAERKEVLAMFEALTKDRSGFLSFMDEANELVKQLHSGNPRMQQRALHTLKGNAALIGFGIVSTLCHEAEEELAERRAPLPDESLARLDERWQTLNEALRTFLGDKGRDVVELSRMQVEKLEHDILAGAPTGRLLDRLASWWLEDAELPLRRLARYAVALANRMGKGDLDVDLQANGVRLAPKAWAGFWSDLVHVVRNAVDHGLETSEERQAAGKGRPRLRLSSLVASRKLVVEVEDFGHGIDWAAVKQAAARMGLASATEEDLVRALFASGLTTSQEASTISGRGIGLFAVRQQVKDLGGQIAVVSSPGQGTCFRFTFPLPEVGPRFGVDATSENPDPSVAA